MKTHSPSITTITAEHFQVITPTTLGYISVEGSHAGISRLEFIETDARGINEEALSVDLQILVSAAVAAINNPRKTADVPLQLQGTTFQRAVWRHLQTIPPGATHTYSDIACALGAPKSHRAVANACGANTIAILIPCHRAIRSDGSYGGYRWGAERKREILRREHRCRAIAEPPREAQARYV